MDTVRCQLLRLLYLCLLLNGSKVSGIRCLKSTSTQLFGESADDFLVNMNKYVYKYTKQDDSTIA